MVIDRSDATRGHHPFRWVLIFRFVEVVSCNDCCVSVVKDADEEAFEDNAEEYMRRDVEGSGKQLIVCTTLFCR